MTFVKGDPNINRKGRPVTGNAWTDLLRAVGEEIEPKTGKPFKELVSKRLWIECVNGNVYAMRELFNRMDGMPKQAFEHSGPEGQALTIKMIEPKKDKHGADE
jgi:hypothetical protein